VMEGVADRLCVIQNHYYDESSRTGILLEAPLCATVTLFHCKKNFLARYSGSCL
jgi:hypothetical protein